VSVALAVVLAVALFTVGVLLVMVLALARHLRILAGTLKRFQADVQPIVDQVNREAALAQERAGNVSRKASSLRLGAKIRR
jgi:uncharacterized protein YoxC